MHNWQPGQYGKGVVDQDGNVHTWNEEDYRFHSDYVNSHPGMDPSAYFYISPHGSIRTTYPNRRYDEAHLCDAAINAILPVDKHFTEYRPQSDWDFA